MPVIPKSVVSNIRLNQTYSYWTYSLPVPHTPRHLWVTGVHEHPGKENTDSSLIWQPLSFSELSYLILFGLVIPCCIVSLVRVSSLERPSQYPRTSLLPSSPFLLCFSGKITWWWDGKWRVEHPWFQAIFWDVALNPYSKITRKGAS